MHKHNCDEHGVVKKTTEI